MVYFEFLLLIQQVIPKLEIISRKINSETG